jgi:AcrR family transcriptional regulator
MLSSAPQQRIRKAPEKRRAEIVAEAARIALLDGLERITVRAVAENLGVRPGLISHYFPATEDLVIAAFVSAISQEREELLPDAEGDPLTSIARMVARVESHQADDLSRLWLNARHLCRLIPALAAALEEQEALDRARLTAIVEAGVASGEFDVSDPFDACIRILVAIDGVGAYINNTAPFPHSAFTHFVTDITEWALALPKGRLGSIRPAAGASEA